MDTKILSSDSKAQRRRLLHELERRPISTLQARTELDIFHPAARVQELRELGYKIHTHRRTIETDKGRHSKVAEYVLLNGGKYGQ